MIKESIEGFLPSSFFCLLCAFSSDTESFVNSVDVFFKGKMSTAEGSQRLFSLSIVSQKYGGSLKSHYTSVG